MSLFILNFMYKKIFLLFAFVFYSTHILAADEDMEFDVDKDTELTVGVAPLITPEYEGADEYRVIPVPLVDIKSTNAKAMAAVCPWSSTMATRSSS